MSCPSWSDLVAHRYAGPEATEPDGWNEALEHLETCSACREAAYAADPTLAFGRQSAVRCDAAEVSRMKAGVDALRRAHRVERSAEASQAPGGARTASGRGERGRMRWATFAPVAARLAAAAGLAAVLLSVHPYGSGIADDPSALLPAPVDLQAFAPVSGYESLGDEMAATDEFFHSTAVIYQFEEDDFDLVMLVDPGLDV